VVVGCAAVGLALLSGSMKAAQAARSV